MGRKTAIFRCRIRGGFMHEISTLNYGKFRMRYIAGRSARHRRNLKDAWWDDSRSIRPRRNERVDFCNSCVRVVDKRGYALKQFLAVAAKPPGNPPRRDAIKTA